MASRESPSPSAETSDARRFTDAMSETLYAELRDIAGRQFRNERADHTLQPTALVNEAFLRLAKQRGTEWQNASHFRAVACNMMRRILVDHARGRATEKRGGQWNRVCLTLAPFVKRDDPIELTVVHDLIDALAELQPRHAQVVEYRIFGGLTLPEIASTLDVSLATVKKDWRFAKAWLLSQLSLEAEGDKNSVT